MEIKVYNNVFEDEYKTFEYDTSKPLLEQIEQHIEKETYRDTMVECYDSETGETFYAPMVEDEDEHPSVIILANNQSVDKNYVPKETDLISVVFLPASERVMDTIALTIGGAVIGIAAGAALGGLVGAIIGIFVGGIIGFTTGYYLNAPTNNALNKQNNQGKEGESLPDVRGAENASLRNNNFPFVIGKHLVTPFVVGDPVTEYTGTRGENAYIRILFCVGYAPLKLTDFKLGEFWLAYNRRHKTAGGITVNNPTYISGLLKGYSYFNIPDNGDILDYWKNNDVSLEILQQPLETGEEVTIDEVYQEHTTIDLANRPQISENAMHTAGWTEASGAQTLYPQHYSTEDERTTVLVTPILSDGTVLTPEQTEGYAEQLLEGETIGVDILLNTFSGVDSIEQSEEYALGIEENQRAYYHQQRYPSGIRYGTIYPYAANDQVINANTFYIADKKLDELAQVTYKGTSFPNKFKTNGVWFTDACPRKFTVNIDFPSGLYETYTHTYTSGDTSVTDVEYSKIPLWVCAQWRIFNENNASSDPNGSDYSGWNNLDFGYTRTLSQNFNPREDSALYDMICHRGNDFGSAAMSGHFELVYQNFIGKSLQNFYSLSGKNSISEVRLSATVTLTNEQIAQLMADTNPGRIIEIRIIRVSPNYMNEVNESHSSESDNVYGMSSYSDHLKVVSVVTESFDEQKYIETGEVVPVRPLSDEDYSKFCLVAIKAKADASGYLINQLKQVNCIAESFSPYWDYTNNKVMPENIFAVRKYYGYFDQNDNRVNRSSEDGVTQREVTRAEYEEARQDGFNWDRQDCGSNYSSVIKRIVFTNSITHNGQPAYKLNNTAGKYNDNSVFSGFMLACVGPQNGPIGLGYENIDMLSLGDWALKTKALVDGTTANRTITYNGHTYHKDDVIPIRMEANGYVYAGQKLEDILQKLAFAGRAVWCADENGRVRVVMDGPVDYTVGVINSQNCISSSNTFSYEDLPAGYLVSFSDENDGYETNQFYVWADGNDEKNHHGQVNPLSVDFVTNNYQMWSLGRYVLATILQTREVLTRKIGVEGNLFKLGDVVLVQSEDLLIGDCSGRIQETIEENGTIYGFICDAPYEYNAEQGEDLYSNQGVTILQPGYAGKSNAVTLPISMPTTIPVGQREFTLEKGTTNIVLFGEPVTRSGNDTSASKVQKYNFKTSDICMFGIRDKVSAPYKITKIKPEKDGCFTETLVPYNEDVYNAGKELPSFQNYITPPQVVEPPISLIEGPSSVGEQQNSLMSVTRQINNVVNGQYVIEPPEVVSGVTAIAERDGIRIVWNPLGSNGMRNVIHHYTVHISHDRGATWVFSENVKDSEYYYAFKRTGTDADGYPEATALQNWRVRISSVNIYGRPAETVEDPPNYSQAYEVDVDNYGTWVIPTVDATKESVDRTVVVTAFYGTVARPPLYGNIKTLVRIKRIGNTQQISNTDTRSYNEMLCVHPDSSYLQPAFDKRTSRSEEQDTEANYKNDSSNAYISISNKITHTLPLIGQNPRMFHAGDIPITKLLAITPAPTDNPQANGWYVIQGGAFVLTTDTTVVEGTTYYADYPVWAWEVSDVMIVPVTPEEDQMIHFMGNDIYEAGEIKFATNGYYMCHGTELTPSGSENPQSLGWYEYVSYSVGTDTHYHYVLTEDTTVASGKTYYTIAWETIFAKSMAVETEYEYEIQMVSEAYQSNIKTISAVALPTNIADIVHAHEYYKELYVEKLSAITANVGLLQQGGMGDFSQKTNCWALSDLSAEDSGVPGGVMKGTFRVGDDNEYFRVTPYIDPSDPTGQRRRYKIELKAGNIELTSTTEDPTQGQGSSMNFLYGTRVYTEDRSRYLLLSPNGIVVYKVDTLTGQETLMAQVTINGNNDMIVANTEDTPEFGYQIASATVYHFDDTVEDEDDNDPYNLVTSGRFVDNKTELGPNIDEWLITQKHKSYEGTVTVPDISNYEGIIGFVTKSAEIQLGTKAINISDGSFKDIPLPLTGYNEAMREDSTPDPTKSLGEYLGLTQAQIDAGIFN